MGFGRWCLAKEEGARGGGGGWHMVVVVSGQVWVGGLLG
jgi:hypothetical protein